MMKKFLLATAASGLLVTTALAQAPSTSPSTPPATSPPAAAPSTPPAATPSPSMPKPAESPSMTKPADKSAQETSKPADKAAAAPDQKPDQKVVTSQSPDQFLASKFSGTDVVGADDKKVGDVSDVLFDKDGKILAYVVSVGGFLGIGSKDVAMAPTAFTVVKGKENESDKLKISMSQEQLKQMASFEAYSPPRATTTGAGGTGRPAGTGTAR